MNNIYDSKYNRLRNNAIQFSAERNEPVTLLRTRRQGNHWKLQFEGDKSTPNWLPYEVAYPDGTTQIVWKEDEPDLATL